MGRSPYTLFVDVKMNTASGAWTRVASSRFIVPTALMSKSVSGCLAAQSCDGCAAVWMTSSIADPWSGEDRVDPVAVSDVDRVVAVAARRAPSRAAI